MREGGESRCRIGKDWFGAAGFCSEWKELFGMNEALRRNEKLQARWMEGWRKDGTGRRSVGKYRYSSYGYKERGSMRGDGWHEFSRCKPSGRDPTDPIVDATGAYGRDLGPDKLLISNLLIYRK